MLGILATIAGVHMGGAGGSGGEGGGRPRRSQVVEVGQLTDGQGAWPDGSFGETIAEVNGVQARVVGLASLIEDKSGPRHDPAATTKDQADVALLTSLPESE